jgi:hypothetical protein
MKKVERIAAVLLVCGIAGVVLADKKVTSVAIRLIRLEGKQTPDIVVDTSDLTIGQSATWTRSDNQTKTAGDDPVLEFTSADPAAMSFELTFDGFEKKQNVYTQNIQPLENLVAIDPALGRPPMVKVVFDPPFTSPWSGVVSSVTTKYTMFLENGTPVRATTSVTMKKASSVTCKKPCP